MNKQQSIKCLCVMFAAIIIIGIGGNPIKSALAMTGCIMIVALSVYVAIKTKNE